MTSPTSPFRILLLEDEPMILMDLSMSVEDVGGNPMAATSSAQALTMLETEFPHAAILDVNLGEGGTCEQVAEILKTRKIPFFLHSGDLVQQGELIERIGAEVVAKPADSLEVADRALSLARDRPENA